MKKAVALVMMVALVAASGPAWAAKRTTITRDISIIPVVMRALRRTGDPMALAAIRALQRPVAPYPSYLAGGQRRRNPQADAQILAYYSARVIFLTALVRVVNRVAEEAEFVTTKEFLAAVAAQYPREVRRLKQAYEDKLGIVLDLEHPEMGDQIFTADYSYDGPRGHHSWSLSRGTSSSRGASGGGQSVSHGRSSSRSYTGPGADYLPEIRRFTGTTVVGDRLVVDADASSSPFILSAAGGGVVWDGQGKIGTQTLKISEDRQYILMSR